jgi:Domain of unknown function (DUF4129)
MTTRQQIARLLPLVLLVVLVIAGLRGAVPAPRWTGPLRADGVAIGMALEFVFGAALIVVRKRDAAARRAAELRPYSAQDPGIEPPQALRFTLSYVLAAGMVAIGGVLIANLHLHFFIKAPSLRLPRQPHGRPTLKPPHGSATGTSFHIPVGPILYGLLIVALVAAVAVSVWWSARLRRPAVALVTADAGEQELRVAVAEGRAALALVNDARAAIIACYAAMERSLAERGTVRTAADTPDELLSRAVAAGTVRGDAAGRLTALFYEARFSTHPLGAGQRDAANAALDEIAAELASKASQADKPSHADKPGQPGEAREQAAGPGGGWV